MPRLSSTGFCARADLAQQREVLHVARADLQDVGVAAPPARTCCRVHHLADHRQAVGVGGAAQDAQALLAQALERVRRGARLVGAAAHHGRARLRHRRGDGERLLLPLDRARAGHQREPAAADGAAPDRDHRVGRVEGARGQLERHRDWLDALHRRPAPHLVPVHRRRVADRGQPHLPSWSVRCTARPARRSRAATSLDLRLARAPARMLQQHG